jgi:hypothetical protein
MRGVTFNIIPSIRFVFKFDDEDVSNTSLFNISKMKTGDEEKKAKDMYYPKIFNTVIPPTNNPFDIRLFHPLRHGFFFESDEAITYLDSH